MQGSIFFLTCAAADWYYMNNSNILLKSDEVEK
jgi:hypothetical protein